MRMRRTYGDVGARTCVLSRMYLRLGEARDEGRESRFARFRPVPAKSWKSLRDIFIVFFFPSLASFSSLSRTGEGGGMDDIVCPRVRVIAANDITPR